MIDFLRLLEEYRRKCEMEQNYAEAKKARGKFDELLKKETIRQKNTIRAVQEQELQDIEAAQKAQFLEFSQAWDNYMSDYEATAYLSLEKLKEKHMIEFQNYQEKIRTELKKKMKFSKDLLELRDREAKLVRMKRYDEAERLLADAIESLLASPEPAPMFVADLHTEMAQLDLERGRPEPAYERMQDAAKTLPELAEFPTRVAELNETLGQAAWATGRREEARERMAAAHEALQPVADRYPQDRDRLQAWLKAHGTKR